MPHTPGPWTVESATSEALHDIALDYKTPHAGSPVVIATTNEDERFPISSQEAEANAKLMAAAPCLLAACKALLPHVRADDDYLSGEHDALRLALDGAKDAIAKAEARR